MRLRLPSTQDFEAVVREHQTAVFRTLARLTGRGDRLEDLSQEVFLRLFRALPDFRGEAALSTYLYRIVLNVAQDEWKRRRREREHLIPEPGGWEGDEGSDWLENQATGAFSQGHHRLDPEERLSEAETVAAVEASLGDLPETERAVLVLFHSEERSYEEIANALAIPVNTVRTHLHRGRKRLAALVQDRLHPAGQGTHAYLKAGQED